MIMTGNDMTIFQTDEYIKAFKIPCNCHIAISDGINIPAFRTKNRLALFMPLLWDSLLNNNMILNLMREYTVKEVKLHSCYSLNLNNNENNRIVIRENSNLFINLPDSFEDYFHTIHERTRRRIKSYINKFTQVFNNFQFITLYNSEIEFGAFKEIIRLNKERCISKGSQSSIDEQYSLKLFSLMKSYGIMNLLKLNDKIVAGIICTRVGNEMYLHVIAHDNLYNDFHVGYVVMVNTIKQAIRDKILRMNLLWGGIDDNIEGGYYKLQFGSQRGYLNDITYYKFKRDFYFQKLSNKYRKINKHLMIYVFKQLKKVIHSIKSLIMKYL